MAAGCMNKVLIAVSLASIAVTVIGFALGYHFMALFLFFPAGTYRLFSGSYKALPGQKHQRLPAPVPAKAALHWNQRLS